MKLSLFPLTACILMGLAQPLMAQQPAAAVRSLEEVASLVTSLHEQVGSLQNDLSSKSEEIAELKNKLNSKSEEIKMLNTRVKATEDILDYNTADINDHSDQMHVLDQSHRRTQLLAETLQGVIAKTLCITNDSDGTQFKIAESCKTNFPLDSVVAAAAPGVGAAAPATGNFPIGGQAVGGDATGDVPVAPTVAAAPPAVSSTGYPCFRDKFSVEAALENLPGVEATYGPIYSWCFEEMDLLRLFSSKRIQRGGLDMATFNIDIGGWDTSRVTNMDQMFFGTAAFNQDISGWNIERVTATSAMFREALAFDQDLSKWNTSSVESLTAMFRGNPSFDQDISEWDTRSATATTKMFFEATAFNQDVSKWDMSKIKDARDMFSGATSFHQDLCAWSDHLQLNASVTTMFLDSGCVAVEDAPFVSAGEWEALCFYCGES